MRDAERLWVAILIIGLMVLAAAQLPPAPLEPCLGLPMADCGQRQP